MHIDNVRKPWLAHALDELAAQGLKIFADLTKKRRIEPDPGGMRDEMEREFYARSSRFSR